MKKQLHLLSQTLTGIKRQIRNLSLYMLAAVISSFIGILINPLLAANLSPNDYAIIGYFTSFNLLIMPLVGLSFINYYNRNFYLVDDDKRRIMKSTLLVSVMVIGFLALILVLVAFYFYVDIVKVAFPFFPYAIITFFPILFSFFFSFYLNDMKMQGKAGNYLRATLANSSLLAVLSIAMVVVFKWGAVGRLGAILIGSLVFGLISLRALIKQIEFDRTILIDALKFCWPISLSALMYFFFSGVDKIMLERLNDSTTFGYYNVAFQISAYVGFFGTALIQTFDPDIYKAIALNDLGRLIKIVLLIIIPCILASIAFILLAEPLINILTYGRYLESTPYAKILTIRNITTPMAFVFSGILIGYGYPKVDFIIRLMAAVTSIFLFRYLIANYGFFGASWGQVISMFVMFLFSCLFILYKKRDWIISLIRTSHR